MEDTLRSLIFKWSHKEERNNKAKEKDKERYNQAEANFEMIITKNLLKMEKDNKL